MWVRSFETIEDLRLALLAFKRTYNEHWMLEKYAYRSPAQVRRDLVGCFRHQLLLPRPYLVLTKPLRLDIQYQRGASVKIGWKYLDD